MAIAYGSVYVAQISLGAKDDHALKALIEAEAYNGPSLVIAYSHCIAHGINMVNGLEEQKAAVASGYWPLFRFNPDLVAKGENPFSLDSAAPTTTFEQFAYRENRFKMLTKSNPERAKELLELAQKDVSERWRVYEVLKNQFNPPASTTPAA